MWAEICRSAIDECGPTWAKKSIPNKEKDAGFPWEGVPQLQVTIPDLIVHELNLFTTSALPLCRFSP